MEKPAGCGNKEYEEKTQHPNELKTRQNARSALVVPDGRDGKRQADECLRKKDPMRLR
jgi:hypothetical protein